MAKYEYDNETDRIEKVTGHSLPNNGANYTYRADSHLIDKIEYKQGTTTLATIQYAYETERDLIASIENKWLVGGSTTVSKYAYANDALGRRTSVVRTGTAFSGGSGDHLNKWGYNDRNELIDSDRFAGTDPNNPGDPNHVFDRAYAYDPIGNRKWYQEGQDPNTTYTANNLNQYTATQDPNEAFSYDDDGNLTQGSLGVPPDDECVLTWNGENRLIEVVPNKDPNDLTAGDKKLEFTYDYMGRRVRKLVYAWDPNAADWSETSELDRRFVYHNWLLLVEYEGAQNTKVRKYVWGLDLAGRDQSPDREGGVSIESAGGIGGLISMRDVTGGANYFCLYDANGNLGQLVDRSDGSVDARYEYDAYGNNLLDASDPNESGPYADDNPIRFSTKYFDAEVDYGDTTNDGLYYFGYRYYSSRLGRWTNRDPLEEGAGRNLYAALNNSPLLFYDALGREDQTAADTSAVCCLFKDEYKAYGRGGRGRGRVVATSTTYCYKTAECRNEGSPVECCKCCPPRTIRTSHTSHEATVVSAYRGRCCFCTISVRRDSWDLLVPHHHLQLSCPSSRWGPAFTITIDRWPEKSIAGPAKINSSRCRSTLSHTASSKKIPCSVGQALKKRIDQAYPKSSSGNGKDTDWDCILIRRDCRSFAYYWYHEAGRGWKECTR